MMSSFLLLRPPSPLFISRWLSTVIITGLVKRLKLTIKVLSRQDIIVRFTSFRYRTMFYRSHKKVKGNARVRLDLTKKRYKLLNDATNYIEAFDHVNYVYADINCHLKVRFMSKEEKFFTSLNERNGKVNIFSIFVC